MKKYLISILIVFLFMSSGFQNGNNVYAESVQYARIKNTSAFLYRTPTESTDIDNVYFLLEKTYFVRLIAYAGENFFEAEYLGLNGYVKISDVDCISGKPQAPYLDEISFRVFAQNGLNLRESPTDEGGLFNRLTTVPFLETNLQYFGKIESQEAVPHRGNTWFYCKYVKEDSTYFGYLYSGYCDMVTNIVQNCEVFDIINKPIFSRPTADETSAEVSARPISQNTQIIIIVASCLPALFIIYLLFKPTRIAKAELVKKDEKTTKKVKKKQNDYYEYD